MSNVPIDVDALERRAEELASEGVVVDARAAFLLGDAIAVLRQQQAEINDFDSMKEMWKYEKAGAARLRGALKGSLADYEEVSERRLEYALENANLSAEIARLRGVMTYVADNLAGNRDYIEGVEDLREALEK